MISVCESYATEHKIIFNGKKSKLVVFSKNCLNNEISEVFVCNEKVERVNNLNYLGHQLYADRNSNMIGGINNDFKIKVNTFLGTFHGLSSKIKNELFMKYCTSFYGSNVCALDCKSLEQLCVSYRKSLRRIWCIPSRTHCNLLPHISSHVPIEVELHKRFLKFFERGIKNDNETVKFIFNHALYNSSRLGKNILYINKTYDLNIQNIQHLCTGINYSNQIINSWNNSCKAENIRIGKQICELVFMRDSLDPWL